MKKKVFGRKLSRERATREALFVSLIENLVLKGKIVTTKAKAKSIIGLVDKLVVLAKKDSLSAKRSILKNLRGNKNVSTKLWKDIGPSFASRMSGFTTMVQLPNRKGDMAEIVRLEWVKADEKNIPTKEKAS